MVSTASTSTRRDVRHVIVNAINDNADIRGPDRYLLSLLPEMAKLAPDCTFELCHAPWQAGIAAARMPSNVRSTVLAPPRHPIVRAAWQAAVFPRWADASGANAIFLPNLIYTPRMRTPCVMTVHDLAHFRFPEKFGTVKGRVQRLQIRLAVRRPDRLIAVSEFTRKDLARFTGADDSRVTEIWEGGPEPIYRHGGPADAPFLLYVGRTERSKNVEGLIDAFAGSEVLRAANVRLLIAGTPGNAEALIRERIAAGESDRIRRLGFVSEDELRNLYLTATAFVFPSLVEGFGLVLLEAMAYGAPIVAMRATAVPDVVGDAGLLVDPEEKNGLRSAMERIMLEPGLRDALSRRGYSRLGKFSWTVAARQTWALIEEVAR
jgi:glycosyltransferase involved in cell wall biosynthesis